MYRELGQIKFKKGEIVESEEMFAKSEEILQFMAKDIKEKRWEIEKKYYKQLVTFFLCQGPSYTENKLQR